MPLMQEQLMALLKVRYHSVNISPLNPASSGGLGIYPKLNGTIKLNMNG
ncbi:hypothetical protein P4S55_07645 [Shewanella sp. PP-Sp27a-2]